MTVRQPRPARHRPRLGLVVSAWTAFTLAQWVLSFVARRNFDTGVADVVLRLALAACWVLITLAAWEWVGYLDRRHLSLRASIVPQLLGLVGAGVLNAIAVRALLVLLQSPPSVTFGATLLYYLDFTAVAYVAIVTVKRVLDARDEVLRQERRQLTIRAQVATAQLEYLEMQLQPHFLFNSLGAVIELAQEAPAASARMLRQLGALLRFAVQGGQQTVPLALELEALEPYLDIQRIRFADWLVIDQCIETDTLAVPVPRLTLQPLVENAIRHGLAGRSARGRITISARRSSETLCLAVRDNGVGLTSTFGGSSSGIGLRNLESRVATLYGGEATVSLRSAPGGGAVTEVCLPARPLGEQASTPDVQVEESAAHVVRLPNFLRRNTYVTIALGWIIWGALWTQLSIAWLAVQDRLHDLSPVVILKEHAAAILIWAALTPVMLGVARRYPLIGTGHSLRAGLHIGVACAFALMHTAAWETVSAPTRPLFSPAYFSSMVWTVMLYGVLLGFASYERISSWLRERETATARLLAELAEARVTAAAMRFDPDLVLSRLEHAADLIIHDRERAERSLTRLGDQLRESLDRTRVLAHAAAHDGRTSDVLPHSPLSLSTDHA